MISAAGALSRPQSALSRPQPALSRPAPTISDLPVERPIAEDYPELNSLLQIIADAERDAYAISSLSAEQVSGDVSRFESSIREPDFRRLKEHVETEERYNQFVGLARSVETAEERLALESEPIFLDMVSQLSASSRDSIRTLKVLL